MARLMRNRRVVGAGHDPAGSPPSEPRGFRIEPLVQLGESAAVVALVRTIALVPGRALLGTAAAAARTIVGTPGNDRLVGTPRADTLAAARKRPTSGGGGSDFLLGGPGWDRLAGPGNDRVSVEYDGARDWSCAAPAPTS